VDKDDEYRRNAEHCRHMADVVPHDDTKKQWHRLAESWLLMIQGRKPDTPPTESKPSDWEPAQ
jgi:hypothetical protein